MTQYATRHKWEWEGNIKRDNHRVSPLKLQCLERQGNFLAGGGIEPLWVLLLSRETCTSETVILPAAYPANWTELVYLLLLYF